MDPWAIADKEDQEIKVIGTRHGEKLFESLATREEMSISIDQEKFIRIPADNRDINYSKYVEVGDKETLLHEDYNSHNTNRLNTEETINLLKKLDFIREFEDSL